MIMIELNVENWSQVIDNNESVLVEVYGSACPPCKVIEARLTEVEKNHGNSVFFAKIEVFSNVECLAEFGVSAVPTILYFKAGKLVKKEAGKKTIEELEQSIKKYLS
jgi:thioredoxin 1